MEATHKSSHSFVPAMGLDWLTPLYDPFIRVLLREDEVKQQLIDQARIAPGMTVVDLGCGTGTLALLVKRSQPAATVIGVDVDPRILEIARGKIAAAHVDVELRQGLIQDVGLAPSSVDRVLTSLVLHHLTPEEKLAALRAVHGVLRPGGELHIADFGPPHNALMQLVSLPVRLLDGNDRVSANLSGRLPAIVREAGFVEVAQRDQRMTAFGTLVFWSAMV